MALPDGVETVTIYSIIFNAISVFYRRREIPRQYRESEHCWAKRNINAKVIKSGTHGTLETTHCSCDHGPNKVKGQGHDHTARRCVGVPVL